MKKLTACKLGIFFGIILFTLTYSIVKRNQILERISFYEAPSFILKTMPKFVGKELLKGEVTSSEVISKDKVLVVHFWATWCAPCIPEIKELKEFVSKFDSAKVKFVVVAVRDKIEAVKKFLKEIKFDSQEVLFLQDESGVMSDRFGVQKVPETFVFAGQERKIKNRFVGPQNWKQNHYFNQISALID